jgi:hypothetical protein
MEHSMEDVTQQSGPGKRRSASVLRPGRYLYVGAALTIALIAIPAFTRTYWAPMASSALVLHPAVHIHAVLFFLWIAVLITQTVLPLRGRIAAHQALGLAGIALAALMVFSGILATIASLKAGLAGPRPEAARLSAGLGFGGMLLFSSFIIAGIANLRRPDWHRRLMLVATISILQAAIARWIMLIPTFNMPQRVLIGAVIVDALLVVIALLDMRSQRRLHPAWIVGLSAMLAVQWARVAIQPSDTWLAFTAWLAAL